VYQFIQIAGAALALSVAASPSFGQTIEPSVSGLSDDARGLPQISVQVGDFGALHPLRQFTDPGFDTRNLGDTFDSETLVADSPAINEFAWVSFVPLGQSLLADGFFQFAGISQLTGFNIEAGVNEFDNGDGTFTLVFATRIEPFSDGFLPAGFTFTVSGNPVDTLGWVFGASGDRDANPDPYDPQLATAFPPTGEFTVIGADAFWRDNGILIGSGSFSGLPYLNQSDVSYFMVIAGAAGSNIDELIVQYIVQSANAPTELTLGAVDDCLNASENQLVVEIDASGLAALNVGGQFFLDYDNNLLDFVSADVGDAPFSVEIFESVNEGTGTIDYAVGVPNGDTGTALPTTMARITFNVLGDFCQTPNLVTFRTHTPPSRLSDGLGNDLGAALINLSAVTKDSIAPTVTPPTDITMNADAGGCDAMVTVPALVASDNCGGVTIVNDFTGTDDASGLYPQGTTTVTWTVTDTCGNATIVTQDVTINAMNTLNVAVELQATVDSGPFDRCITFELIPTGGGSPIIVSETMTFTGGIAVAAVDVPCGDYECIMARDTLHTLRKTDNDNFAIVGTNYNADFTTAGDNDALIGGNLNDDDFIDILDFGILIGQFGSTPGADTACGFSGPHADITGDGSVLSGDFTFIQINFLEFSEAPCSGAPLIDGGNTFAGNSNTIRRDGPVTSISVDDLIAMGMPEVARGDLNHDGMLDESDVAAFLGGVRPDHIADIDRSGTVDFYDLQALMDHMGQQVEMPYDMNGDGVITIDDLQFVVQRFGMNF
jgi:EF hand